MNNKKTTKLKTKNNKQIKNHATNKHSTTTTKNYTKQKTKNTHIKNKTKTNSKNNKKKI